MSRAKKELTNDEYYRPITRPFGPRINNLKAIESYGENTEPKEGKPTKSRVLRTKDLTKIQLRMIALLQKDIIKNSKYSWVFGSLLQSEKLYLQPLGDYPTTNP